MKSTQGALTIDASGPSQEQNEFINRQVQDLQKLIEPLVQQALTSTSGGIESFLTPEVQKKIDAIGLRLMGRLEELGKRCQECWKTLIAHGWFLSPDTPVDQLQNLTNSLGENASSGKKIPLDHFQRCCIARGRGRHSCLPLERTALQSCPYFVATLYQP